MIEFIEGKWTCDECGNWWSDKPPAVCDCDEEYEPWAKDGEVGSENGEDV